MFFQVYGNSQENPVKIDRITKISVSSDFRKIMKICEMRDFSRKQREQIC